MDWQESIKLRCEGEDYTRIYVRGDRLYVIQRKQNSEHSLVASYVDEVVRDICIMLSKIRFYELKLFKPKISSDIYSKEDTSYRVSLYINFGSLASHGDELEFTEELAFRLKDALDYYFRANIDETIDIAF